MSSSKQNQSQRSIKSFFKPKENASPNAKIGSPPPNKKSRTEGEGDSALSPDQRQRMTQNAVKGKLLRLSKMFPSALDGDIGVSWFSALEAEFGKPFFADLNKFLESERKSKTIYPAHNQVWSWSKHFALEDTKVVILGQDPYHGPNQAHGLCFSVQRPVKPPPSLLNMFKELESAENDFVRPDHGDLTGWAEQGVLLLNAVLTVEGSKPNSHKDRGWEKITDAVIKAVSDKCEGVVFLLWGSYAQKKGAVVNAKKHHLLKTVHPSPLSAHRGFMGCGHFQKCNELLQKQNKKPIQWEKL